MSMQRALISKTLYGKNSKNWDTLKIGTPKTITIIVLKMEKFDLHPKHAAGMANCVGSDQTAPEGAV